MNRQEMLDHLEDIFGAAGKHEGKQKLILTTKIRKWSYRERISYHIWLIRFALEDSNPALALRRVRPLIETVLLGKPN